MLSVHQLCQYIICLLTTIYSQTTPASNLPQRALSVHPLPQPRCRLRCAGVAAAAAAMVNPGTMDVLTGRIAREVYFDTKKLVGKDGKPAPAPSDEEKFFELEFAPVKVVQELPNEKVAVVRDDNDQVRWAGCRGCVCIQRDLCLMVRWLFGPYLLV